MTAPLFTARDVCVQRDGRRLGPWSMSLAPGERVLVTGANGSGKSSLLAVVCGWLEPVSGLIERPANPVVGIAPEPFVPPHGMTGAELLQLIADTAASPVPTDLASRFDLSDTLDQRLTTLSRGQLKRIVIASAFIGSPPLVVLDEPLEGLDAASGARIRDAVTRYVQDGGCALIATHRPRAWGDDGPVVDLGAPL